MITEIANPGSLITEEAGREYMNGTLGDWGNQNPKQVPNISWVAGRKRAIATDIPVNFRRSFSEAPTVSDVEQDFLDLMAQFGADKIQYRVVWSSIPLLGGNEIYYYAVFVASKPATL